MSKLFTLLMSIITKLNSKATLVDGKVPKEQLPDDIGGGVTSWNDLEDKPFYEEVDWLIEWDTNPTNSFVPVDGSDGFYKVSDIVPTKEELIGARLMAENDGDSLDMTLSESDIADYSEYSYGLASMPFFVITTQATEIPFMGAITLSFPSAGVWFVSFSGVTYTYYLGKAEVKQIDPKFIPSQDADVGLSDYYTKSEIDNNHYTKSEIDNLIGDCNAVIQSINTLIGGENS